MGLATSRNGPERGPRTTGYNVAVASCRGAFVARGGLRFLETIANLECCGSTQLSFFRAFTKKESWSSRSTPNLQKYNNPRTLQARRMFRLDLPFTAAHLLLTPRLGGLS